MKTQNELTPLGWMTIEECSAYTGLTVKALYAHVHRGTLPCHRIGKLLRFNRAEIDQAIRSQSRKRRQPRRLSSRTPVLITAAHLAEEVLSDGN